jgi:hypothetical protein
MPGHYNAGQIAVRTGPGLAKWVAGRYVLEDEMGEPIVHIALFVRSSCLSRPIA